MVFTEAKPNAPSLLELPYVELSFGVIGETLPADHGYGLYSAISRCCPEIHELDGVSIQTITGFPDRKGKIHLSNRSRLRIRLLGDLVPSIYRLAGKQLGTSKKRIECLVNSPKGSQSIISESIHSFEQK